MDEKMTKDQILLTALVSMFQTAALQFLGKLKNPLTDKVEKDLDAAKYYIDILDYMERKTKGNLDETEQRTLKSALHDLRLNYVYERDLAEKEKTTKKEESIERKTENPSSPSEKENHNKENK